MLMQTIIITHNIMLKILIQISAEKAQAYYNKKEIKQDAKMNAYIQKDDVSSKIDE